MNKRKFTYKDYNMTPARRRELIAFCEQYQDIDPEKALSQLKNQFGMK